MIVLVSVLMKAEGNGTGAPQSACTSFIPTGHHDLFGAAEAPNQGPAFVLEARRTGNEIAVQLKGLGGNTFKGYMIQATNAGGHFTNTKTIDCDGLDDTATHRDPSPKQSVLLKWTSGSLPASPVTFRATVVINKVTYVSNLSATA